VEKFDSGSVKVRPVEPNVFDPVYMDTLLSDIRQLIPPIARGAFDKLIEGKHFAETSVDRFITLMESFKDRPAQGIMDTVYRVMHAMRDVPDVNADAPEVAIAAAAAESIEYNAGGKRKRYGIPNPDQPAVEEVVITPTGETPGREEPALPPDVGHVELQRKGPVGDLPYDPSIVRRYRPGVRRDPRSGSLNQAFF